MFCRFAGCNLWTGREEDRAGAVCTFCDTDFVGMDGTERRPLRDAEALADASPRNGRRPSAGRFVVCTGGEPLLQLDPPLIEALHARGFAIAIETNGTIAAARRHRLGVRQPEGRRAVSSSTRARN